MQCPPCLQGLGLQWSLAVNRDGEKNRARIRCYTRTIATLINGKRQVNVLFTEGLSLPQRLRGIPWDLRDVGENPIFSHVTNIPMGPSKPLRTRETKGTKNIQ